MKHIGMIGIVMVLFLPALGCVCNPGYNGSCGTVPFGCGSLIHNGVVDYVNGNPGATEADCGNGAGGCYSNNSNACGPCTSHGVYNCGSCLGVIGDGVRVIGEGAFTLAASPFIFVGNLISGGYCAYETFPNCGCSNEVYYGDNCYQAHDFNDPCAGSCDPCGCGGSVATTGCTSCAGGYVEGIRFEGTAPNREIRTSSGNPSASQPANVPTPVRNYSPVSQTSFRRPVQAGVQRIVPPKPLRPSTHQMPPRPLTISNNNQALPQSSSY